MQRDFKGIWIPKEIWLNEELTLQEKVFLVEINAITNEDRCEASDEYFSNFFQIPESECAEIINSLANKGFIEIWYGCEENLERVIIIN